MAGLAEMEHVSPLQRKQRQILHVCPFQEFSKNHQWIFYNMY